MSTFVKKNQIPETVTGTEGSAKRNIIRKGGPAKTRKEGLPGQSVDDGSMETGGYALDEHDPNYDSEEETGKEKIPKYAALHRDDVAKSSLTLSTYKHRVEPIISEFFTSGDFDEVTDSLEDIGAPEYSYEFVKRLVNTSCDKGDRERELVSKLLSASYPDVLSSNMIGKGFERLFEIVDEIEKDCPAARSILTTYIARAVIDEIIPPSFLNDSVVCNLGGEIVEQAKIMLSREHGGAKLERSWGPGDGRPVEEMKVNIDQLLQEYLLSGDMAEAVRCVTELKSPQFYHEIVKRAVINAMDKPVEEQLHMSLLLRDLFQHELLSSHQAVKGFNRLFTILPDLKLDTPNAESILHAFMVRAKEQGVLSDKYNPPTSA